MPIVKAQCTNCGGTLEVDNDKEAAICPFCNTPYIVEKAVQQFNVTNTYHIEHAVIESGETDDKLLQRGIAQLEMKEYKDALDSFRRMSQLYPTNYKAWLGLCLSESQVSADVDESAALIKYRKNTLFQCPDELKSRLNDVNIQTPGRVVFLTKEIEKLEGQINIGQKSIEKYKGESEKHSKVARFYKILRLAGIVMVVAFFVLIIIGETITKHTRNVNFANGSLYIGLFLLFPGIAILIISSKLKNRRQFQQDEGERYRVLSNNIESSVDDIQKKIDHYKRRLETEKKGNFIEYYISILKGERV